MPREWPNIPYPQKMFEGNFDFPVLGESGKMGQDEGYRWGSKPVVSGSCVLILEASKFVIFKNWWRNDLNDGLLSFTAEWVAILGYVGYSCQILKYSASSVGGAIQVKLDCVLLLDGLGSAGGGGGEPDENDDMDKPEINEFDCGAYGWDDKWRQEYGVWTSDTNQQQGTGITYSGGGTANGLRGANGWQWRGNRLEYALNEPKFRGYTVGNDYATYNVNQPPSGFNVPQRDPVWSVTETAYYGIGPGNTNTVNNITDFADGVVTPFSIGSNTTQMNNTAARRAFIDGGCGYFHHQHNVAIGTNMDAGDSILVKLQFLGAGAMVIYQHTFPLFQRNDGVWDQRYIHGKLPRGTRGVRWYITFDRAVADSSHYHMFVHKCVTVYNLKASN